MVSVSTNSWKSCGVFRLFKPGVCGCDSLSEALSRINDHVRLWLNNMFSSYNSDATRVRRSSLSSVTACNQAMVGDVQQLLCLASASRPPVVSANVHGRSAIHAVRASGMVWPGLTAQ